MCKGTPIYYDLSTKNYLRMFGIEPKKRKPITVIRKGSGKPRTMNKDSFAPLEWRKSAICPRPKKFTRFFRGNRDNTFV